MENLYIIYFFILIRIHLLGFFRNYSYFFQLPRDPTKTRDQFGQIKIGWRSWNEIVVSSGFRIPKIFPFLTVQYWAGLVIGFIFLQIIGLKKKLLNQFYIVNNSVENNDGSIRYTDDRHRGQRGFPENLNTEPHTQKPERYSTMNRYFLSLIGGVSVFGIFGKFSA